MPSITGLPDATLPLGGDETMVIVQDGETVEAPVSSISGIADTRDIEIQMSCSDLTTPLTADTDVAYVRAPRAFTITGVRASLLTASSSGPVTVDINVNGSTILSTKITIDANENTSLTAVQPVVSAADIDDDDVIAVDIDADGTDAAGLIVTLLGTY